MKSIIFAICTLAVIFLTPTAVYAAQTSRTLQPGNVYEFTGIDARVISHINVTGTGRYDIVAWDSQGEITRFGTGTGRFSVSGTGGVAITPIAPLSVTFDTSRIRLQSRAGSALTHTRIPVGQTVSFANNNSANLHIRTHQLSNFDYVIFNRAGHATDFAREVRLPQISVPVGGSITITAALRETSVYFPSRLAGYVAIENLTQPALHTIELLAGQVYALSNSGDRAYNLRIEPPSSDATFAFEYITRGRDGHVTSHGERDANQLQLAARHSISITPIMDGEMFFPSAWLRDINVGHGVISPVYQTIQPGRSLTITNTDAHRSHSVFIRCPDEENGFVIDYVTVLDDEVTFNTAEIVPGGSKTLSLQAGAQTTITILEAETPLAISFPDIAEITSVSSPAGAIVRYMLDPGQSVYIRYSGEESVRVLPVSDERNSGAVLDYVRYYDDEIESFGTFALRAAISFETGQSALITNAADEEIILRIPQFYLDNGLNLQASDSPALFRLVATSPTQIENRDRHYNHSFSVQNETGRNVRQGASVLEFVTYSTGIDIADFGELGLGTLEIPAGQRMIVAPVPNGISPSIVFPAAWYGVYFRTSAAQEAPLHRITLRPGRRLTITNNTRNRFELQNNSETSAAGYALVTTPPREQRRELAYQCMITGVRHYSYVSVQTPVHRGSVDNPAHGLIEIPANSTVVITATSGASLELWLPARWARQLRLVER